MYKNSFFIPQADTTPSIIHIHGMAIVAVQTVMSHTCKLIIATWLPLWENYQQTEDTTEH